MDEVETLIQEYIENYRTSRFSSSNNLFQIQDDDFREIYHLIPDTSPSSAVVSNLDLDEVTIWDFSNNHVELRLKFTVDIEADINCEWMDSPSFWSNRYELLNKHRRRHVYDDDYEDDYDSLEEVYPRRQELSCLAELYYDLVAEMLDKTVVNLRIEEVYRR
jgi:hypothetical protein